MRRLLIVLVLLLAACGGEAVRTESVEAGPPRTKVTVVTDWSGDGQGAKVIRVTTPLGDKHCIVWGEKHGGSFGGSPENPKGRTESISCDWQAR